MENNELATRLVRLAKELTAGSISREIDTLYGKSGVALADLDSEIRRDRTLDTAAKKKLLNALGDVIDAHDKLGDITEDYR